MIKSTTSYGYVLTLDGGALLWKYVKNQTSVLSQSTMHKLFPFPMHPDN